jgi:CheY-like chemotaxis protein
MKTILLVDDSRLLRLTNERALARAGYSVMTAADGEEALRTAFERVPDLIILDMLLPRLGGPQVLRSLRQNNRTTHVPVVVLSSLPQSNEARLKEEGATAYYDKSKLALHENADSLVQIVRDILVDNPSETVTSGNQAVPRLVQPGRRGA